MSQESGHWGPSMTHICTPLCHCVLVPTLPLVTPSPHTPPLSRHWLELQGPQQGPAPQPARGGGGHRYCWHTDRQNSTVPLLGDVQERNSCQKGDCWLAGTEARPRVIGWHNPSEHSLVTTYTQHAPLIGPNTLPGNLSVSYITITFHCKPGWLFVFT